MAISCPVDLDTLKLRAEIQSIYARVARIRPASSIFIAGLNMPREAQLRRCRALKAPRTVTESFAGVGNPHAIAPLPAGATVVDIGSGAWYGFLLAAFHVGPHGRAIGIDMTEAMRDERRRGATGVRAGACRRARRRGDGVADRHRECGCGDFERRPEPRTEKRAAVREIRRVLKPGGRVQIADIVLGVELPEDARQDIDLWTG
jgi:SAM-dependent methyltransferase